jgi:hypothetical protein
MELTEPQRQKVKEWLASGASLSDVQKNLKSEFGIALTYMDVRLLVLEIGAEVKDKPEPKQEPRPEQPRPEAAGHPPPEDDPYADEFDDGGAADGAPPPGGAGNAASVSVSLDRVVRPGAMVSGDVTFSDGNKGKWLIDQYGRFGLDPDTPGYRPSPADLQAFQLKLRDELRRHGYG